MKIKRFEDIQAWQEARVLVNEIYAIPKSSIASSKDFKFKEQITSAAVSIMSNVAEGFSRKSDKEFAQFLFVAKGSCAEVQSLLYVALDQNYLTQGKFDLVFAQTDKIARFISNFITYLSKQTQQAQ